jgi:hypothetical protein
VSSCVTKATEVVRRLPRAGVALPVLFLGDHGNKQQQQQKNKTKNTAIKRVFSKHAIHCE